MEWNIIFFPSPDLGEKMAFLSTTSFVVDGGLVSNLKERYMCQRDIEGNLNLPELLVFAFDEKTQLAGLKV